MAKQKNYSRTTTQDTDQDGDPDSTTVETFKFDRGGNLVEQTYQIDYTGDEVFDYAAVTRNTYDKAGNLLTTISEDDHDADGSVNATQTTVNTYERGKLVTSEYVGDWENDGVANYRYAYENTYNRKGLLETTIHRYSNDGDLVWEQVDKVTFGYDGKDLVSESYDFGNDGSVEQVITYDALVV